MILSSSSSVALIGCCLMTHKGCCSGGWNAERLGRLSPRRVAINRVVSEGSSLCLRFFARRSGILRLRKRKLQLLSSVLMIRQKLELSLGGGFCCRSPASLTNL